MIKKFLLITGVSVMLFASCFTAQTYQITGKPIGTKVGVAKTKKGIGEAGIKDAAKNGGITKIGAVEITYKFRVFSLNTITKVYGE